jgi:hypothetical protein
MCIWWFIMHVMRMHGTHKFHKRINFVSVPSVATEIIWQCCEIRGSNSSSDKYWCIVECYTVSTGKIVVGVSDGPSVFIAVMGCLTLNEGTTLLLTIGNHLYHLIGHNVPGDLKFDLLTSLRVKYEEHVETFWLQHFIRGFSRHTRMDYTFVGPRARRGPLKGSIRPATWFLIWWMKRRRIKENK